MTHDWPLKKEAEHRVATSTPPGARILSAHPAWVLAAAGFAFLVLTLQLRGILLNAKRPISTSVAVPCKAPGRLTSRSFR